MGTMVVHVCRGGAEPGSEAHEERNVRRRKRSSFTTVDANPRSTPFPSVRRALRGETGLASTIAAEGGCSGRAPRRPSHPLSSPPKKDRTVCFVKNYFRLPL